MSSTLPTIALFTATEGHESIAVAVAETLAERYNIVTFQRRDSMFNVYVPLYQFFPQGTGWAYKLSQGETTTQVLGSVFKRKYQEELAEFYQQHQPVLLINTYFMFNPGLEKLQHEFGVPFINILTDPWTIHPLLIAENASTNWVFDQHGLKHCQKMVKHAHYTVGGWQVRQRFTPPANRAKVRQQLDLDSEQLTLLVTTGSEGTAAVLKLMPALTQARQRVQVTVACGNNTTLLHSVTAIAQVLNKLNSLVTMTALGFTPNLHLYLQAADLVVGKAGPNTIFESVATHTPFFAMTHIAGQEDGNLELIKKYKLGFAEENPLKVSKLLLDIIQRPQQLQKFSSPLKKMAEYNKKTPEKLLNLLENSL